MKNGFIKRVIQLLSKVKMLYEERGLPYVICAILRTIMGYPCYCYYRTFKFSRTFSFQGEIYKYFYHPYSMTWRSERAVEVPIVHKIVSENRKKNILEVGNVLSHYFNSNHDILDKYEKAVGIINQDVVDYNPRKLYDLVVSISTVEHIGWDEKPREPLKILYAMERLKNLLAPKGKMVVTFALGYNPVIDRLVRDRRIRFNKQYCMKRTCHNNWKEIDCNDVICHVRYSHHSYLARVVFVGIIEAE